MVEKALLEAKRLERRVSKVWYREEESEYVVGDEGEQAEDS